MVLKFFNFANQVDVQTSKSSNCLLFSFILGVQVEELVTSSRLNSKPYNTPSQIHQWLNTVLAPMTFIMPNKEKSNNHATEKK